jgi:flagellar biosynthesis protein FlhF
MHVHTFRARTIAEALRMVREELGADASVLSTRETGSVWTRWLTGTQIEITASAEAQVPSRLPAMATANVYADELQPADLLDFRRKFREDLLLDDAQGLSLIEELCRTRLQASEPALRSDRTAAAITATAIPTVEPIQLQPGRRQVIALVGPTGVGKTTTIAKLAAYFRLREHRRVGLITVDTYRIAAVEQLKTYAEIMDLPVEVVATPQEMRSAVDRLAEEDLILIDTAGRSPRDAVRLTELRGLLAESQADQVHLVLSAVAAPDSFDVAAGAFSTVGASALILTKLDEAVSLAWLPAVLARHRLPLSYTTSGQNVPDDIAPANAAALHSLVAGS